MKKTHAIRIAFALVSLAALALLLPVLGMVLLGLLTLVLPMLLVLSPVLVLLSLVFVADRLRGRRVPAAATGTEPVSIGELAGVDSVQDALRHGAPDRPGPAIAAFSDDAVVAQIAERGFTPSSVPRATSRSA